jgi:hypothetical protein
MTLNEAVLRLKSIQFEHNKTRTHLYDVINMATEWEVLPPHRSPFEVAVWNVLDTYLPDLATTHDQQKSMMDLFYSLNTME